MNTTIFTHMRPDLDAAASIWAAKKFAGFAEARVCFKPGHWDGDGMSDKDIAVDIPAGGRGVKGVKKRGTIHSAFASIIGQYADDESKDALSELVAYVDAVDTATAPKGVVDLNKVCQGLMEAALVTQPMPVASATAVSQMEVILEGLYVLALQKLRASQEADKAQWVENGDVKVAITHGGMAVTNELYARGARAVVFIGNNSEGCWMSASRASDCTVNLSKDDVVKALFDGVGEGEEFFAHPAGFMLGRGSFKAPMATVSTVAPLQLAEAVAKVIATATKKTGTPCMYCGKTDVEDGYCPDCYL